MKQIVLAFMLLFSPAQSVIIPGPGGAVFSSAFNASDSFAGSNGTTLTAHDACWTQVLNGYTLNGSGGLNPNSPGPDLGVWNCGSPSADQYSQYLFGASVGGGSFFSGPCVRCSLVADTGYSCLTNASGTRIIYKIVAGSATSLTSDSYTPSPGDTVRMSVIGTALTCTINGGSPLTTTDSSIASGRPGFRSNDSAIFLIKSWAAHDN